MNISVYKNADALEIQKLFTSTFSDSEGVAEGALIGSLVLDLINDTAKQDLIGFTAVEDSRIVGCIFFTRLLFDTPVEAFLLSPVAVHSNYQGKNIGQSLINYGLACLEKKGVTIVFTYGDPKFYSRVGFAPVSQDVARAPFALSQPQGWLGQCLDGSAIEPLAGTSQCVKAFNNPVYW